MRTHTKSAASGTVFVSRSIFSPVGRASQHPIFPSLKERRRQHALMHAAMARRNSSHNNYTRTRIHCVRMCLFFFSFVRTLCAC